MTHDNRKETPRLAPLIEVAFLKLRSRLSLHGTLAKIPGTPGGKQEPSPVPNLIQEQYCKQSRLLVCLL